MVLGRYLRHLMRHATTKHHVDEYNPPALEIDQYPMVL